MSIWTRTLWGAELQHTPVSEAAKRCARIRAGGSSDVAAAVVAGTAAGLIVPPLGTIFLLVTEAGADLSFWLALFKGSGWLVVGGFVLVALVLAGRIERSSHDRHQRRGISREWLIRESRGRKRVRRLWVGLAVGAACLGGVCAIALNDGNIFLILLGLSLGAVGMPTAAVGLFGRKGARLVCGECDYPMTTWRGAAARCPECGNDWRAPWGARFGVRGVRWRIVGAGFAMLSFGAMLLAISLAWK